MDFHQYFDQTSQHAIHARRHYLSTMIRSGCDSVVQYGILKGFRVPPSSWAEIVSSAYILGTYEVAVCAILEAIKGEGKTLVDLGGADGVFGVGLVETGAFARSLIFEMKEDSRRAIAALAEARGLSDRVAVHGEARHDVVDVIEGEGVALDRCVVLCDIEGAEFTLFTDEVLRKLRRTHVIIELHDFLLPDPAARETAIADLKRAAEAHFHVHEIQDGLRDMRRIPILQQWSDWDTWLLCVEARYRMMSWLWLQPKGERALSPAEIDALVIDYQRRIFSA